MARRARDEVVAGLKRAGFRLLPHKGDHDFYALYVNETKTPIKTKVSRGSHGAEISRKILGFMAEQVKLEFRDFERLIDGDMGHLEYVNKLREKGVLK